MTQAPVSQPLLPGTDGFDALLGEIAAGAKDRDLNDQNPFDQVIALKRAGFGTLRLPADLGGPGFSVPATVFGDHRRRPRRSDCRPYLPDPLLVRGGEAACPAGDPADAVSRRWLDEVAAGKLFANAFSEKGTLAVGSLVFNTRLLPDGDGAFRLDGEKFYSTGTLFSDYLTVATTTDHDSVASVIVPTERTGVR